ncbi:hypothetical protein [Natronobacterium gregoryi]|uniref:Uncharacterized protein n=2 Tax=Natronobacterium gregoryi TaxID=44930 RepID=L0AN62_NATGS|nr:hypothetical protein [Natronobacterium gregoryi]AFZ74520.1 hypothetical protein Natgr_3400 [Natronobacterium gregoryi SP2]ELY72406.1 hypothetical protein C490_03643 [Natronobacterium gregoryi SP2]PLK21734.1 hypothetical protein CYV19_02545 [Natronobacterium gregoryi SP2]SFI97598.1 hypothetical protein SAMN05443661_110187 [Natronobacterium gregoryi]
MQRNYRYTAYVLALAALVLLVTVGFAAAEGEYTTAPADASLSSTDFDVGDHDDVLTDEEVDELVAFVRENESLQDHFDGVDTLQTDVYQSHELDDGELVAIDDEYDVRLSPPNNRLPRASVTVSLEEVENALAINGTTAAFDDVSVTVEDSDRLTDDEADRVTSALLDDDDITYNVQASLGEPDAIELSVTDRDDDEVDVTVTTDDDDGTIHATVDLDEKTVRSHHMQLQFETDEGYSLEFENGTLSTDVEAGGDEDDDATDLTAADADTVGVSIVETDDESDSDGEFYIELAEDET